MPSSARALAATTLVAIIRRGRSLDKALDECLPRLHDPRERALVQELTYGVVRWYWRFEHQLDQLLTRGLRNRDTDIKMLLMIGLHQLQHLGMANHAAVDETVSACGQLDKPWATGLVNAVLRNAIDRREELCAAADRSPRSRWSHPDWFVERIAREWPRAYETILDANNQRPPLTLRVNTNRMTRDAYLEDLARRGIRAIATPISTAGVRLDEPLPVSEIPGFDAGIVSVQDEAAQLAAGLLECAEGIRVLDACAAPGGKTTHLLEIAPPGVSVVAVDRPQRRIAMIEDNLRRLALACDVRCADLARVDDWWDGSQFQRVLLDAPCSSTGVIRRHPDIKIHRQAKDLEGFQQTQEALLRSVWRVLAPGGKLVYVTCSVIEQENDDVVAAFLGGVDDSTIDPIDASWGAATRYGRQILPGRGRMDGFYYARIRKGGRG
jgi:16S rRNA (cytosine967-C5)-methyltransferase